LLAGLIVAYGILAVPAASAFPALSLAAVATAPSLDPRADASTWTGTATASLTWDVVRAQKSSEPATVHVATNGRSLFLRFDVPQQEAIAASQRTNDVGQGSDDDVWVDLWPEGVNGYQYQFFATPIGTRYESSSENTSYSPVWQARGATHDGGYTVTMKIPLNVIRGAHAGPWKVEFARLIHATGEQQIWSYQTNQTQADDIARAGTMTMPALAGGSAERPKPRLALYGLGAVATKAAGGSTSRVGADLSIPITATSSFYSTFHPDYSNVELDQQSISPTVFARFYSEVRPFFTQAAQFYNNLNCNACPAIQELYTPAIPTPIEGYAVEGKQGPFGFATFDALGNQRNDLASSLDYSSPDTRFGATVQRVAVSLPGLTDVTTTTGINYYDLKHISGYFDYGSEAGTNVLAGDSAQRYDLGGGWMNNTFALFGSMRKLGAYYNPVDGFVSHPGIAGYALYSAKIWDFSPHDKLESAGVAVFGDRYMGPTQGIAQSDNSLMFDVLTKSALDLQLYSGSNYWRFGDTLTPVSQNAGIQLTYHSGTQTNNVGNFPNHGSSSTPTTLGYYTGRYGDGRLDTWYRSSTIRAGSRGTLTFTVDNTAQWLRTSPSNVQWFDSASYAYQIDRDASIAFGLRTVVGMPPVPNGGGNCIGRCSNVSIAYHQRLPHLEIYTAYGDPNTLLTVPQFIFKLIFYAGADKGT
jgi:hypothetical protein